MTVQKPLPNQSEPTFKNGKPNKLQQEVWDRIDEVRALAFSYFDRRGYGRRELDKAGIDSIDELISVALIRIQYDLRNRKKLPVAFSTYICKHIYYALATLSSIDQKVKRVKAYYCDPQSLKNVRDKREPRFKDDEVKFCKEVLKHLDKRDRKLLNLRMGNTKKGPLTLQETGVILGVSKERVRQLEIRAIERARKFYEEKYKFKSAY